MHRATDPSTNSSVPHGQGSSVPGATPASSNGGAGPHPTELNTDGHVCPFCGLTREITEDFDATSPCPRCTLADTPTTRNATKARIGPWHVRQMRNPWAPGMRWETLLALIKRGQVTRDSIVRGPTTQQLWRRASEIKGLSREFGVCYSCGGEIDTQANLCGHCNRLQEPPVNPNVLVETREFANQAPTQPQPQPVTPTAPVAKPQTTRQVHPAQATGSKASTAGGGNGHAFDEPPHIDIGASTPPPAADPDEMLTVDDPEHAAALARSITSRAPARPSRPAASTPASMPTPQPQQSTPAPAPAASSPPAPAPRPMTLRPRPAGTEDALLTPQELAAAFQLNFAPAGGLGAGAPPAPAKSPAMPIDDEFFPTAPRRKRSKLLAGVFVLLLAAGGAAVLGYLRPDLRDRAEQWSEKTYASVKQFIASRTSPAGNKPTLEPVTPPSPSTRPAQLANRSPATRPAPIVVAPRIPEPTEQKVAVDEPGATRPASEATIVTPSPAPVPRQVSPPTARETTRTLDPIVETPSGEPSNAASKTATVTPSPDATAAATAPPVATPVAPPKPAATAPVAAKDASPASPKVWTNLSDAEDEARRLWRQAIDAEQNQDFVEAVRCYEQIKKLPADAQPRGLDVRLSLAKKLTK